MHSAILCMIASWLGRLYYLNKIYQQLIPPALFALVPTDTVFHTTLPIGETRLKARPGEEHCTMFQ